MTFLRRRLLSSGQLLLQSQFQSSHLTLSPARVEIPEISSFIKVIIRPHAASLVPHARTAIQACSLRLLAVSSHFEVGACVLVLSWKADSHHETACAYPPPPRLLSHWVKDAAAVTGEGRCTLYSQPFALCKQPRPEGSTQLTAPIVWVEFRPQEHSSMWVASLLPSLL